MAQEAVLIRSDVMIRHISIPYYRFPSALQLLTNGKSSVKPIFRG